MTSTSHSWRMDGIGAGSIPKLQVGLSRSQKRGKEEALQVERQSPSKSLSWYFVASPSCSMHRSTGHEVLMIHKLIQETNKCGIHAMQCFARKFSTIANRVVQTMIHAHFLSFTNHSSHRVISSTRHSSSSPSCSHGPCPTT